MGSSSYTRSNFKSRVRKFMSGPPVDRGIRLLDGRIPNSNFQSPRENPSLRTQEKGNVMVGKRIRVLVPAPVEAPRGAEWAASAVVWILRVARWGASAASAREGARQGRPGRSRAHPAPSSSGVAVQR